VIECLVSKYDNKIYRNAFHCIIFVSVIQHSRISSQNMKSYHILSQCESEEEV